MQSPSDVSPREFPGLVGSPRTRRLTRRRLGVQEMLRLPCLLPAAVVVSLGLLSLAGGASLSVIGYTPKHSSSNSTHPVPSNPSDLSAPAVIGPLMMAIGIFAIITACVFYCELIDKYAMLVPDKRAASFSKDELYEIIRAEMKKSYAQTLITAYSKAAERSLLLSETQSCCEELLPEPVFAYPAKDTLTIEQQIDIECEGYTPSPPVSCKRYSVIQARIQRLKSEDNWLKTSSLPNIRRSISFRRASRIHPKPCAPRTLSCDYTMDEARLRRKSMMLRNMVQWNSGSSDAFQQRQRRRSSIRVLPPHLKGSMDDVSQFEYGSFPMTRLIERRGTFACGDMRTRRMKFLLLLEASESQEAVNEWTGDGRHTVAAIRRNSFIPYTTCDKFIADEEKKTTRDRRRSSVNPFSVKSRFPAPEPAPGTRRHSFYPIRRDTKIYNANHAEIRRHSYNPHGMHGTLRPEFLAAVEHHRSLSASDQTPGGDLTGQSLHIPPHQTSRFLQVPGLDPFMEARPLADSQDNPPHSLSDPGFGHRRASHIQSYSPADERRVDRRHSFSPLARTGPERGDLNQLRVPRITIKEESSDRYLTVPNQDYVLEEKERRHSFNVPSRTPGSPAAFSEKPNPQRISFNLEPTTSTISLFPPSTPGVPKSTLKTLKPSLSAARPTSFQQEMVIFSPLVPHNCSSTSPGSTSSCFGSTKEGSMSRTASFSSDRSANTTFAASPASVAVPDHFLLPNTPQKTPTATLGTLSPKRSLAISSVGEQRNYPSPRQDRKISQRPQSPRAHPLQSPRTHPDADSDWGKVLVAPDTTSSGSWTLTIPATSDSRLHRSKSASALSSTDLPRPVSHGSSTSALSGPEVLGPLSPRVQVPAARVAKPSSPLVTRHKPRARRYSDKRKS